jgi:hypothetical protein
MIQKITIDHADIHILTSKKDLKIPVNNVSKIYIKKGLNLQLGFLSIVLLFSFLIPYIYFDLYIIFYVNIISSFLLILALKEFVFLIKSKYFIVIITNDNEKHIYSFKSDLKYDAFYVKDQFYYYTEYLVQ